jgi:hypothetical protein
LRIEGQHVGILGDRELGKRAAGPQIDDDEPIIAFAGNEGPAGGGINELAVIALRSRYLDSAYGRKHQCDRHRLFF